MKNFLIGLVVVLGLGAAWAVMGYNSFVNMDVAIDTSWSQVQVQYQRRFDMIPNLVETVKGVANFEKSTYEAVTAARSAWAQAQSSGTRADQIAAAGTVDSALSRLLVTVENYPELKANENFTTLQAQIEGTENRVAVARKDYNDTIRPYNTKVRSFPSNLLAGWFGFEEEKFFEGQEGSAEAPKVNFGN